MNNTTDNQENVENMAPENKTELQNILNQIRNLNLDGDKEGILCIAFTIEGDNVSLQAAIQGKHGRLVNAISETAETDEHFREILQKGLITAVINKLK
jgi:hypothetical protein